MTGVQTCALPISPSPFTLSSPLPRCPSPFTLSSPLPRCPSPFTLSSPLPRCPSPFTLSSPLPRSPSPFTLSLHLSLHPSLYISPSISPSLQLYPNLRVSADCSAAGWARWEALAGGRLPSASTAEAESQRLDENGRAAENSARPFEALVGRHRDRKSTRLNSSH